MYVIIERMHSLLLLTVMLSCLLAAVNSDFSVDVIPLEHQAKDRPLDSHQKYLLKGIITRPTVHYIYIMETSDSTRNKDGHCGTVLECLQAFLTDLHEFVFHETIANRVIVNSLIVFDDYDHVLYNQQNHTEFSLYSEAIYSSGGNRCDLALRQASKMQPTVVILAGDGICDRNVTRDAAALGDTGAVVHSIAVGDDSYCEEAFARIPRNGGTCISMPSSNHLSNMLLENYLVIPDGLDSITDDEFEYKVDNEEYQVLRNLDSNSTTFSTTLDLPRGIDHVVCVRFAKDEECVTITYDGQPAAAVTATNDDGVSPGSVAGISIGVLATFAAALALLLLQRKRMYAEKESDTNITSKHFACKADVFKEEEEETGVTHEIL
mmetsp:Transcript_13636/g.20761  ORF Transcript_13636/g.20761 Transcript_13636/m.20761 type:complete len:379 (+) Transcript_13636:122-1258(+)